MGEAFELAWALLKAPLPEDRARRLAAHQAAGTLDDWGDDPNAFDPVRHGINENMAESPWLEGFSYPSYPYGSSFRQRVSPHQEALTNHLLDMGETVDSPDHPLLNPELSSSMNDILDQMTYAGRKPQNESNPMSMVDRRLPQNRPEVHQRVMDFAGQRYEQDQAALAAQREQEAALQAEQDAKRAQIQQSMGGIEGAPIARFDPHQPGFFIGRGGPGPFQFQHQAEAEQARLLEDYRRQLEELGE
jgi:hypothetical protein